MMAGEIVMGINSQRALRALGFAMALLMTFLSTPASALEVIDSNGGQIYVEAGKGRLLRLDEAPATVFLADPNIADIQFKSTKLVYLVGKVTGETSLFALDKKDRILLNRKIVVGYDLDQLTSAIDLLIPDSGIKPSMVNNTLVLDGVVSSPAEAEAVSELAVSMIGKGKLLNRIKVSMANQVNLRVIIAEVSRSIGKEFGFDFSATGGGFQFASNLSPRLAFPPMEAGITESFGPVGITASLKALEAEGLVTILSEPNLTAISGETASFLAGGELPFTTIDDKGNIVVAFKPFGVSLSFTPTLLDDSRIHMKVRPEVSQLSANVEVINGVTIRGINTRRTETTVELGNGESLAVAGLIQSQDRSDNLKVPGLGDLPIIGALFRSQAFNREETELMIVVTPYVVRPTSERLAIPTDGYQATNDYDRYMGNVPYRDTHGSLPDRVAVSGGQRLVGSPGFQVE